MVFTPATRMPFHQPILRRLKIPLHSPFGVSRQLRLIQTR